MNWERLYTILLNPNHEFSFQTFLIIALICILVPNLARWMIEHRQMKNNVAPPTKTTATTTYHTPKKKKRTKKK